MSPPLSPTQMDRATFVAAFGHVFEHSPWVAEAAWDQGLPADADTAEGLHRVLGAALAPAPAEAAPAAPAAAGKFTVNLTVLENDFENESRRRRAAEAAAAAAKAEVAEAQVSLPDLINSSMPSCSTSV